MLLRYVCSSGHPDCPIVPSEMPLLDVVGNGAKVAPEQIGATAVNVGVAVGLTVIVNVVVLAHCPVIGVKV